MKQRLGKLVPIKLLNIQRKQALQLKPTPIQMVLGFWSSSHRIMYDIKNIFGLMLKNNGYVLEQLHSPLVVHTTPEHEELILYELKHHWLTIAFSLSSDILPR